MNAVTLLLAALALFAIGYRFYGLFIAKRVLEIDPGRPTPAVTMNDGRDHVPTNRYLLFGHHFAAIAAAGPLMGPILAAQFGYLPGALWIILGCVLAGAVHDMVALFASVRSGGRSLGEIARDLLGPAGGMVASLAILAILLLTLAGLSIAVVNAMADSPWASFTIFSSIPIALIMGFYMEKIRPGDLVGGSVIGVVLLLGSVFAGHYVASNPELAKYFMFSRHQLAIAIALYAFIASVLPVWMMLCPRDYLSSYLKIGTITLLAVGILFVSPALHMPAVTQFIHGGGPIINGSLFPFLFITIACGAISGFHSLIATGTTPKMISNERDIPFVGYGAMVVEGFVAIMALISACVLIPADYFAINATPAAFAKLNMHTVELDRLSAEVQENLAGRPGGGVSLAVGMAHIFSKLPGMEKLMAYWYHYAIMFEALFVLTAVDAGTRVGRFLTQELCAKLYPKFNDAHWLPGVLLTGGVFTLFWGYMLYIGDVGMIWPLFGMSNQLLGSCTLLVVSVFLILMGKARFAWLTLIPGLFLAVTTFTAGFMNFFDNYMPKKMYLLATLTVAVLALTALVFVLTGRKALALYRAGSFSKDAQAKLHDEFSKNGVGT